MLFWIISQLQSLIFALHSKDSPRQIAAGFAIGSLAGWVPFNLLYSTTILLLLYVLNVNTGFGILGIAILTLFSYLIDPWAGKLGEWLLTGIPALKPLWTFLYNLPIVPFTRFNNSVMLGSLVIALILAWPIYKLAFWGVLQYRARWKDQIEQWRIIKWANASKLVTLWIRIKGTH